MQAYQERVVNELQELTKKREKLIDFMGQLEFHELNQSQKSLLNKQAVIMEVYADILEYMIMSFTQKGTS